MFNKALFCKLSRFQRKIMFLFFLKNAIFIFDDESFKKNYENASSRCRKQAPDGRTHRQRQLRAPTVTTNSLRFAACFARYARFASDKHINQIAKCTWSTATSAGSSGTPIFAWYSSTAWQSSQFCQVSHVRSSFCHWTWYVRWRWNHELSTGNARKRLITVFFATGKN